MPSGGARNRSGPPADPDSGRSAVRGLTLLALPADGYRGEVPKFPLPGSTGRERALWRQVWRTPQACGWAVQPWRHYSVGQWVRWSVRAEDPDASAALVVAAVRFADQIGLTPAGLRENGWAVSAPPQVEAGPADDPVVDVPVVASRPSARSRLKVVPHAGGG